MDKTQKIALVSIVALIVIAGGIYWQKSKQSSSLPQEPINIPVTPNDTVQQPIEENTAPAAAPQTIKPSSQLEPLPADDKQAIDSELNNIDTDLKSTDNTINSTDLSNANLGL